MKRLDPPVKIGTSVVTLLDAEGKYENGRTAVQLYSIIDAKDGGDGVSVEPYDTLSVNLPDDRTQLVEGEFFTRDYGYHEINVKVMVNLGYIELVPGKSGLAGGHGPCSVGRLTRKTLDLKDDGDSNAVESEKHE